MPRTAALPRLVPVVEEPSILSRSEHEEGDEQDGPSLASAYAAREKDRAKWPPSQVGVIYDRTTSSSKRMKDDFRTAPKASWSKPRAFFVFAFRSFASKNLM